MADFPAEFPVEVFRLDGDPAAIRSSAVGYQQLGDEAGGAAGQIRSLDTSLFVGPEAVVFIDSQTGRFATLEPGSVWLGRTN